MTIRDRLVQRAVSALLAILAVTMTVQAIVPSLRSIFWSGIPFAILFAAVVLLSRAGRSRLSAWLFIGIGVPLLLAMMIFTGGPDSRFVAHLSLAAMAALAFLGPRVGAAVVLLIHSTLLATWILPMPPWTPPSPLELLTDHITAIGLGTAFLASVTRDLQRAAELAWERARQAEQAAQAAHAADEARDRFMSTVSHELRTPLDAVLGYSELLLEEEQDPERAQDLRRIRSAGRQLLGLVDDLLDMSLIEADALPVDRAPIDLAVLVEEVAHTTGPLVAERRNRLQIDLPGPVPALCGDQRRIRQIVLNLISNAAKYTSDGEIALQATVEGATLRISVRDTGIGIPADRLSQLFVPFVQLHEGLDRRPGIGLGLALSQRLAIRLGGRIEARSEVGVGSTFTLELPLGGPPEACG